MVYSGHAADNPSGHHERVVTMSDAEIIELFDTTNITLAELSARSGRSIKALKALLMGS